MLLALAIVCLIAAIVWAWQHDRDQQLAQQLVSVWEDKSNNTYLIDVTELREDGELISAPLDPSRRGGTVWSTAAGLCKGSV